VASVKRNRIKEAVVVIPARGGSKGLPGKNIIDLCGKPLIAYAIEVAQKATRVDRIIVSTDDRNIADIALQWGAEVPFLRPSEMAGDRAFVSEAIDYTLGRLYGPHRGSIIEAVMYPTSPFRSPALLDHLLEQILNGCTHVRTVKCIPAQAGGYHLPEASGNTALGDEILRKVKATYRSYGVFSASRWSRFMIRWYNHVLHNPISLIDIDTLDDLHLAEAVIREGLFDFERGGLEKTPPSDFRTLRTDPRCCIQP
jgi:hypothetical protein